MRTAVSVVLAFVAGAMLTARPEPAVTQEVVYRFPRVRASLGEHIYLSHPAALLDSIGFAEGVPSYGHLGAAREYGNHRLVPPTVGRGLAAVLMHRMYREWVKKGRPGDFLYYLSSRWAPIGAANDPTGLNRNWLPRVLRALPSEVYEQAARDLLKEGLR